MIALLARYRGSSAARADKLEILHDLLDVFLELLCLAAWGEVVAAEWDAGDVEIVQT